MAIADKAFPTFFNYNTKMKLKKLAAFLACEDYYLNIE